MTKMDEFAIIPDGDLAVRIGELFCEALYDDLSRQNPLSAADRGTYWRVEGSWNREGMMEGPGEFFLSIVKADGRVSDIGEVVRIAPHPSVVPIIKECVSGIETERKPFGLVTPDHSMSNTWDEIDPAKSAECMLLLTKLGRGGVVYSANLAVKLGEALCEARYGDLARQRPLTVSDKGTYWRVDGRLNQAAKLDRADRFFVSFEKYNGRVIEIGE